jgi:hypothetical protein
MKIKISIKEKKGLEMSFGWLFAIVVGAVILFLAIFIVTKLINTNQTEQDVKTSKEIGVLLDPLETGFESSSSTKLKMPSETRIYAKCEEYGNFGKQLIQVSQKNFKKWTKTDLDVGFENKYIFAEQAPEGKEFYVFSKAFEFPFKIADLIYLTSTKTKYCFSNTPNEIKQELNNTGQMNFIFQNCEQNDVKVCFLPGNNCNITIYSQGGYVEKSGTRLYFEGNALMYAAVFSDPEIYECQLNRLMKRLSELATIYQGKAIFISDKCNSDLNLEGLIASAKALSNSQSLGSVSSIVYEIKDKNDNSICRLW